MKTPARATHGPPLRTARRTQKITICLAAGLGVLPLVAWASSSGAQGSSPPEPLDVVVTTPDEMSVGVPIFTLPWGDGPGQVGIVRPEDEEARGPEAFAVAADGRFAIVDSVNHRLVLLAATGERLGEAPIPLGAPRFVAAGPERVYVLDADEDLAVLTYSWDGRLLATAPVGPFAEPATALLLDADGLPVVETSHETVVAVDPDPDEKTEGSAATARSGRTPRTGRPDASDPVRWLGARMIRASEARIEETADGRGRVRGWDLTVEPGTRIDHLVSLSALPDGDIAVGIRAVHVRKPRPDEGPKAQPQDGPGSLLITLVGDEIRSGGETRTIVIEEVSTIYLGVPYVVGPDGAVYQPLATVDGYRIAKHTFPEVTR